jgi:hypothetical protein
LHAPPRRACTNKEISLCVRALQCKFRSKKTRKWISAQSIVERNAPIIFCSCHAAAAVCARGASESSLITAVEAGCFLMQKRGKLLSIYLVDAHWCRFQKMRERRVCTRYLFVSFNHLLGDQLCCGLSEISIYLSSRKKYI